MQLSKKADYALRAATILASLPQDKSMQTQELAAEGGIPIRFLEQILSLLKRGGFLISKRGVGGGYRLAKEARFISVGEIIEQVDGELCMLLEAGNHPQGFPGATGLVHHLSKGQDLINDYLHQLTLEQLLESENADVGYGI
ncbi:MAG: Rrf2 family transcriptional regulator [Verrucomicrobiota bacterium]